MTVLLLLVATAMKPENIERLKSESAYRKKKPVSPKMQATPALHYSCKPFSAVLRAGKRHSARLCDFRFRLDGSSGMEA